MTEIELLERIENLLDERPVLWWHHCGDSRRCQGKPGLPDLLIAGPAHVIAAELKTDTADTNARQDQWLWLLASAGVPVYIWRPADLDGGDIEAVLDYISREA